MVLGACHAPPTQTVAVGTALAGGPPHGSGRAELLHPALALGNNANAGRRGRMITTFTPILHPRLTYPLKRVGHAHPALRPGHVTLGRLPLGQSPFLHRPLASGSALFGGFAGTMGLSDFPWPCIIGVRPWTFRCGLGFVLSQTDTGSPGFRSRCLRACAGSQTAPGPNASRDTDASRLAFRPIQERRYRETYLVPARSE